MPDASDRYAAKLAALAQQGGARSRRVVEARGPGGVRLQVDGRDCLAFCSNDYLGLADHPEIVAALCRATRTWGVGSGASHLISGHTAEHHALEEELADFVGRPRALLFSTGYMANLAIGATFAGRGDCVFEDRLNHASLLDAGLASGARFSRYAHADAAALGTRLARRPAGTHALVLSDGVFSMDGVVAPLGELAEACSKAGADLCIDDAHGFGVLGPNGAGCVAEAGLGTDAVPLLMCTLGKAAGTSGAFVAGPAACIENLLQRGRTYIYTTALPPAVAAGTRASLRVMREEPWRRQRVQQHAQRFRAGASLLGLQLMPSRTPIQPIVVGSAAAAIAASSALFEQGLWVPAIRPPTVPKGSSRLRCTFSAAHGEEDVDRLLDALAALVQRNVFDQASGA